MLKVMTIVGTRPEIIKLSRVIDKLDKCTEHILVHTGQNFDYELNDIFFEQMRIKRPRYYLNSAGKTSVETIANVLVKADEVLEKERPDAVLIYGDTNSCLSVIAAKRKKIPIFHMEAGNRCFDQRVPEEINRKMVDHLSDINMPISEHARRYLLQEGIKGETIIKTGSSMKEVFDFYKNDINKADILEKLKLKPKNYFVVSSHREENVDSEKNFKALIETLNSIADKYKKRIIVSTHPRTMKKVKTLDKALLSSKIEWIKPVGFFDYIKLQKNAFCVISDSGTVTEEAALLSFPAVTIRNAHERPEGMDEGVLIMSGLRADRVLQSVDIAADSDRREAQDINRDMASGENIIPGEEEALISNNSYVCDYNASNVSDKVVRIIMSYTDYIRRTVWREME
ncbi:UDP-N-acetylglucosamine 2-epimerase (non-hydrolysing) [Ruminiclostridium sufflavum DSM 19573]|uniref:UDP-N-acetylglucosamine 2-epimerase (Non-hydrolysing) n=1 Tax=Ruminiclostridium sufflavum DSM 19573 TaxID=1121337 RepID=A0A318XGW4_9FIRM|nr:UDP-N-acetylglucosamine 2-epimerase (non-hydrolyzing) [Ruminiclostridium sufflavum]PYG85780.1 UDP-N-acetylglucosamine 2-epimerase (non-hydrolysing) [Ruminiclostridium sufflavum DSM 19573]